MDNQEIRNKVLTETGMQPYTGQTVIHVTPERLEHDIDAIQELTRKDEREWIGFADFRELAEWLIVKKRSVFIEADIPKDSQRKILNWLGYSSDILDRQSK